MKSELQKGQERRTCVIFAASPNGRSASEQLISGLAEEAFGE